MIATEGKTVMEGNVRLQLFRQTEELTADLRSAAAISINAVPGSEPFTSVDAVGLSPQLCVCLAVCLFACHQQ